MTINKRNSMILLFVLVIVLLFVFNVDLFSPVKAALTPVMVYKTRGDYYNHVPVYYLSEDETEVSGFASPKDICKGGKCPRPVRLNQGYLAGGPGFIGPDSAFLRLTYEEYSQQNKWPYEMLPDGILDTDPFLELYDCSNIVHIATVIGPEDEGEIEQLNELIEHGYLKNCKQYIVGGEKVKEINFEIPNPADTESNLTSWFTIKFSSLIEKIKNFISGIFTDCPLGQKYIDYNRPDIPSRCYTPAPDAGKACYRSADCSSKHCMGDQNDSIIKNCDLKPNQENYCPGVSGICGDGSEIGGIRIVRKDYVVWNRID